MASESAFIILFCVATAVAMLVRRYKVPYTVALVLTGLGLGALHVIEAPHLTKELLFAVFLPGLLFEAAFHMDASRVRDNARTILSLAVPGVVAGIGLTAVLTTLVVRGLEVDATFTLSYGLVFGALVAATDPIAVVALFRSLNVPRRLSLLVEGESLLNDGTAIVFFTLIVAFVTGANPTASSLVVAFFATTVGGALIGVAVGMTASQLTKRIDEPAIEITLTVVAAYGSFVAAEQIHVSGVIATVAAGLVYGNYGRRYGMSPPTRIAVESFWEYIAFALNSIVFLLIGFDVPIASLGGYWREIIVALVAMIVARFGVVFAVTTLLQRTAERVPTGWTSVLAWGGIRGGLSIVLALGLPRDLPHRDQLVTMTVGVVLMSILLQGMTMAPLLRRLGLVQDASGQHVFQRLRTELRIASSALEEIQRMLRRHTITASDAARLSAPYEERIATAHESADALARADADLPVRRQLAAVRHLLSVERERAAEDLREDLIAAEAYSQVVDEVSQRMVRLDGGTFADPAELLTNVRPPRKDEATNDS